ncbi:extracellular calcium-sensing receptor-like [Gadus macrocephalus]|uniref:extracellular calcium-sensing receptor-like n=1 Tax=Gadus macrocephalus TaxID=80720 RepID=UPI0028CB7118|nr:extracellular calcium-sensing receptor-like [Gadus macrocephalus]
MSWVSLFLPPWSSRAPSLLLLVMVGRDVGLRVGLEGVQTSMCSRLGLRVEEFNQGQDGDVVIGGLFNLHYQVPGIDQEFIKPPFYNPCTGLEAEILKAVYAMEFAVEEINRNPLILPGVKLNYRILDDCGLHPWVLHGAFSLVGGERESCTLYALLSSGGPSVPLIIGGASSTTAMILSRTLASLSVPVISYLASCPCLSDRHRFPNFFRTIPSDVYQAKTMARLAILFNWTWIGAVIANNDYGRLAIQAFQEEIEGSGVCLAFSEFLNRETFEEDARRAASIIEHSTARVILIFTWHRNVRELFLQLAKRNVTDRQFLASEAWSTSKDILQDVAILKVASGVLGVAIRSARIPGFKSFLQGLKPSNRPGDLLLQEFWEKEFECSLSMTLSNSQSLSDNSTTNISPASHATRSPLAATLSLCTGRETLEGVQNIFTDTAHLRAAYNTYLAVYAAAHALHSFLSCPDKDRSPRDNSSTCSSPYNITQNELLEHLNKVNFTTPNGEEFFFQGADIPAAYDLVNWKTSPDGSLKLVLIGRVDGLELHLNQTSIQWTTGSNQVPISVCSASCPPGTRRANRKGEPVCCFDCIPCTDGEVSNETGSHQCRRCPVEFWSNPGNTACIPRKVDFLSFNETMGIVLTTGAVSGVVVTTVVFVIFLCYHNTPVVRANNSELSFLLLLSLKLCFLCALVFIGRPSVWSCRLQQAAFGISFVLCVSCLQVKTIVVLAAFRSARPGAGGLMKWFGPGQQRGSVCFFTSIQVIICTIWLSLSPPIPHRDLGFQGSKVNLECAMSSVVGFAVVLGYIGFLACLCLLLAFLARKLPDNFNEAKFITFSMLIFCAVWVAFVPAYISSPGKYSVAVEIFAILASSYGLLLCIFAPKCFIILLRPERNTKKQLMGR